VTAGFPDPRKKIPGYPLVSNPSLGLVVRDDGTGHPDGVLVPVMIPPAATAATTAAEVQRAAAGTAAWPSGLPLGLGFATALGEAPAGALALSAVDGLAAGAGWFQAAAAGRPAGAQPARRMVAATAAAVRTGAL
jgi:hypothetical protein